MAGKNVGNEDVAQGIRHGDIGDRGIGDSEIDVASDAEIAVATRRASDSEAEVPGSVPVKTPRVRLQRLSSERLNDRDIPPGDASRVEFEQLEVSRTCLRPPNGIRRSISQIDHDVDVRTDLGDVGRYRTAPFRMSPYSGH